MPCQQQLNRNFSWGGGLRVEILPNFACGLDQRIGWLIYRSIDLKRFCVNNWWTKQWLIFQQSRWNLKVRAGECVVNPLSLQRKPKTWVFQVCVVLGVIEDKHLDVPDSDHHHVSPLPLVGTKMCVHWKAYEINRKGQAKALSSLQKETQWKWYFFFSSFSCRKIMGLPWWLWQ